jgi:hypothetical protein
VKEKAFDLESRGPAPGSRWASAKEKATAGGSTWSSMKSSATASEEEAFDSRPDPMALRSR